MTSRVSNPNVLAENGGVPANVTPAPPVQLEIALLAGGFEQHYTFGLAKALIKRCGSGCDW